MKDKIKYYLPDVLTETNRRLFVLKEVADWKKFSTKLKSELISNIVETSFSSIVPGVTDPKKDSEPDLYVDGVPLELKTSRTTNSWRGGEFSKRTSDYLLIAWNEIDDTFQWFVTYTFLTEDNWTSSTSSSYYATIVDLDTVLSLPMTEVLVGSTLKKKVKHHTVYEQVGV